MMTERKDTIAAGRLRDLNTMMPKALMGKTTARGSNVLELNVLGPHTGERTMRMRRRGLVMETEIDDGAI